MLVRRGVDQLGGDANLVTRVKDRAFDHSVDFELACDLRERLMGVLVGHRGSTRDDPERADLPEVGDQLVSDAVGEVVLRRFVGEAFDREHGERANHGRTSAREGVVLPSNEKGNDYEERGEWNFPASRAVDGLSRRVGASSQVRSCGNRLARNARRGDCGSVDGFYFGQKAVAAAWDGFDEARAFGGITQSVANLVDRFIEAVVEVDECVRGPKTLLEFLAGYDIAGPLNQHRQNADWLLLQANAQAVLAKFTRLSV